MLRGLAAMNLSLTVVFSLLALSLGRSTLSGSDPLDLLGEAGDNDDLSVLSLLGPSVDALLPNAHSLGALPGSGLGPSKASPYNPQAQQPPLNNRPEDAYAHRGKRDPEPADVRPTPEPTGASSATTTVHIIDEHDFALLLPDRPGELISDAESDGVAYCTPESPDAACGKRVAEGFIRAATVTTADDGSYIQVTGCLDVSKSSLDPSDSGGQFDVRFPNGAQCTYGGYGASFIQLVEPAANRFCLRCCRAHDDQASCNSHQDRAGCQTAIPGTYAFPALGVTCEE